MIAKPAAPGIAHAMVQSAKTPDNLRLWKPLRMVSLYHFHTSVEKRRVIFGIVNLYCHGMG